MQKATRAKIKCGNPSTIYTPHCEIVMATQIA